MKFKKKNQKKIVLKKCTNKTREEKNRKKKGKIFFADLNSEMAPK